MIEALLLTIAAQDRFTTRISPLLAGALALVALWLAPGEWVNGVWAAGLLALLTLLGVFGGGDWKLAYGLGVLAGEHWLLMVLLACGSAALMNRQGSFPFAPYLVGATYLVWVLT